MEEKEDERSEIIKRIDKEGLANVFQQARVEAKNYTCGLRERGRISFSEPVKGDVPSIHIVRRTIPENWEDIIMALMGLGQVVHTYYDPVGKNGEWTSFPSMEATVIMHTIEPRGEPRFHNFFLGGGLGIGDYQAEIEGVKDHWMINPEIAVDMIKKGRFDEIKKDEKWKYTYSQRLTNYPFLDIEGNPQTINQINSLIKKLKREPLSKSAQAVTWDPRWDHNDGQIKDKEGKPIQWQDYDSPCLQRFWFRLIPVDNNGTLSYQLNTNSNWRSRCHLKAVPQNKYGTEEGLIEPVRQRLEQELGVPISRGRDIDISDSLHLYGHYFDIRKHGKDAEQSLDLIFKVARGEPIEKRLAIPGTPVHEFFLDTVRQEYEWRKANPNKDSVNQ